MRVQPFEVGVGVNLRRSLSSFIARGVYIDNFTNQWLREPSTGLFIPPYWGHVVIPLEGVNIANLQWASPGSIVQPAATAGTIAVVVYTEDDVQLSAGTAVPGGPSVPISTIDASDALLTGQVAPLYGSAPLLRMAGQWASLSPDNIALLTGQEFGLAPSEYVAADVATIPIPWDFISTVAAATGALASITIAAQSGRRILATMAVAHLVQVSGALAVPEVDITGLQNGTWSNWIGVNATAGDHDQFAHEVSLLGFVSTAMTFAFSNLVAGTRQSLAIGAYLF